MEIKKQISLEVVHPNACGIDIGSRSHWAAVGQNAEDVKEFGVISSRCVTGYTQKVLPPLQWNPPELTGKTYFPLWWARVLRWFWWMADKPKTSKEKRPTLKIVSGYRNCILSVFWVPVFCQIRTRILYGPIPDTGRICWSNPHHASGEFRNTFGWWICG